MCKPQFCVCSTHLYPTQECSYLLKLPDENSSRIRRMGSALALKVLTSFPGDEPRCGEGVAEGIIRYQLLKP